MGFAVIQFFIITLNVMLYYGNYSLRSEESVPLALALFEQPQPDLKATKAEKTAVASGEYWQVTVTTL